MFSRKHPSQKRSRQTVARILEATQSILVTDGIKAVTTNAIAERSGVTVGSIYQYFGNKEEIIVAIFENWLESIISNYEAFRAAHLETLDGLAYLESYFDTFLNGMSADEEKLGVELANAVRTNPKLAALDQEHDKRIAGMLHDDAVHLGIAGQSAESRLRTRFLLQVALDLQSTVAHARPEEKPAFRRFAYESFCAMLRAGGTMS